MLINEFPQEILALILDEVVKSNVREGVTYTYGLTQAPLPLQPAKISRYLRGPVCPDDLLWDATFQLRQVCKKWHDWSLQRSLKALWVRRWRGSERWAELPTLRTTEKYKFYELVEKPSGYYVRRDPFGSLRHTEYLFKLYPKGLASHIRRLWFNGFYTPETDALILSVLRSCRKLTSISIPWALLRHGTAEQWTHLLGIAVKEDPALRSLELQATDLDQAQERNYGGICNQRPLEDSSVDFSNLQRLKFVGNTSFQPITDVDAFAIARTATNLEELHFTNIATVTIAGVMALVKASRSTIRVIEHSPLSDDGFCHPHPGALTPGEHTCATLTACPNLKDLSVSLPCACATLFANPDVLFEGELQVRCRTLCGVPSTRPNSRETQDAKAAALYALLNQARRLITSRRLQRRELDVELFFADCNFDPKTRIVHGDFQLASISAGGLWPAVRTSSPKGPYGTTGLYGKDEGTWDIVSEEEFFIAVEKGWLRI